MADPNKFLERTKQALALRAAYRCSLEGCGQITVGPGSESPTSTTKIGEAAHIRAASPGGKRYVAAMSPKERAHISNGIWLCVKHARLIDRDETEYTATRLREMKRNHEAACAAELRGTAADSAKLDLIAIGPDIVALGELGEFDGSQWSIQIGDFVSGDLKQLVDFTAGFNSAPHGDRYALVNALGDGRVLAGAPTVTKTPTGFVLRCPVEPSFARVDAHNLGSQWAISPKTGDLYLDKGNIARVSGVESLPQVIRQCLSLNRGESPFHPTFGARLSDYFENYRGSPWLDKFIKLEVIRQASIPYEDELQKKSYLPLRCVERVWSIELLSDVVVDRRLPMRMDFDIKGVGAGSVISPFW